MSLDIKSNAHADVVELADALASGASGSNLVRVQVPPSAPSFKALHDGSWGAFLSGVIQDHMVTAYDNFFVFLS